MRIDFKQKAVEKWTEIKEQVKTLNDLEKQGFISERFRKYCTQLINLDGLSEEAEAYALYNNIEEVTNSFLEMRKFLSWIYYNYSHDKLEKPSLSSCYKGLSYLALERYSDAVESAARLLGEAE